MKKIGTIPNLISLTRFIGGILFIPLHNTFHFSESAVILIIIGAWFTDILDGWVARKMNQISNFGKFIDPVADKVFVFALVLYFLFADRISLFYFIAVIGRDILILLGGFYVSARTKVVLPSNLLGKICVFSIGIYFLALLLNVAALDNILKWISLILIFLSLIVYFIRAYELIKDLNYVHKEN